jgi:hypothetical protein
VLQPKASSENPELETINQFYVAEKNVSQRARHRTYSTSSVKQSMLRKTKISSDSAM